MSPQPSPVVSIGSHEVTIDGPELLHVRCIGEMSAADVQAITAYAEAHLARLDHSYMMVDLRRALGMDKEARRLVADWLQEHRMAAVVNFGGSLVSRAFSNLAIRALQMLHGQSVENVFVATEAEARAWVSQHRAQRAGR